MLLQIQPEIVFFAYQWTLKSQSSSISWYLFVRLLNLSHKISSSENVSKRDAILAPVAKQWIAKDIPSYGSQSRRAKIAIHWFGKY